MAQENTFVLTEGLKNAIAHGELYETDTAWLDREDGLYWITYSVSNDGRSITLTDIAFCKPTNEMHDGKPMLQAVPTDIDPTIVFNELADYYKD